jgi:hypothetical protein
MFSSQYDAVCLILDVGLTSSRSGFIASAISCASEQIQRKVFSESADRFGIVLCGSDATDNKQNYSNIVVHNEDLVTASFELLEFVEKEVKVRNIKYVQKLIKNQILKFKAIVF